MQERRTDPITSPDGPSPVGVGFIPVVPRWLGLLWLGGAVLGIVAAVVGAGLAISFVSRATAASVDALRLSETVFEAVDETGRILDDTFVEVAEGLDTVQVSVADASITLDRMTGVTDELTSLLTDEVPASLDAVRDTMPQLIRTAGVIDTTMRALRFVGVDYDPDAPLDEALIELDDRLATIPEDLRDQRPGLEDIGRRVGEFAGQSRTIAADVGDIRDGLDESRMLIEEYQATAAEARSLTGGVADRLTSQSGAVQWVIIAIAAALVIGQTLPLAAGWWVLSRVGNEPPAGGAE